MKRDPTPAHSAHPLRYTLSPDGSYRTYPDGRQVCCENAAGRREYLRRVEAMVQRQDSRCGVCNRRLSLFQATFDHWPVKRGMGSAFRSDAILDSKGEWLNRAVHWACQ